MPNQQVVFIKPKDAMGRTLKGQVLTLVTNWNDDLTSAHQYLIRTLPDQEFWQGYLPEERILKSL